MNARAVSRYQFIEIISRIEIYVPGKTPRYERLA